MKLQCLLCGWNYDIDKVTSLDLIAQLCFKKFTETFTQVNNNTS